jgi:hypothetical protein
LPEPLTGRRVLGAVLRRVWMLGRAQGSRCLPGDLLRASRSACDGLPACDAKGAGFVATSMSTSMSSFVHMCDD